MKRVFDNQTKSENLFTDENGTVSLGKLENILSVNASYAGNVVASKVLDNKQVDMPRSYTICEGEDLVLPSRGLALSEDNFELIQSDSRFGGTLGSSFNKIKAEGTNIVLTDLSVGVYSLIYKTPCELARIGINVLKAKRWENSPLMIDIDNQLLNVDSECRFLNIQNISTEGANLNIDISSNDVSNAVVHVMGYNFSPVLADLMSDRLNGTTSHMNPQSFNISQTKNIYISGKNLGDEMNYVLDRKNKKNFIGNTLKKPSILLHRKFIRETTEDEEKLKTETQFDRSSLTNGAMAPMSRCYAGDVKMMKCKKESRHRVGGGYGFEDYNKSDLIQANYEYISESGLTLSNLKPNENGQVQIPLQSLGSYSKLVVFVSDTYGHVMAKHSLQPT